MSKEKVPWVSQSVSQSVTRSPIELFWKAKNTKKSKNSFDFFSLQNPKLSENPIFFLSKNLNINPNYDFFLKIQFFFKNRIQITKYKSFPQIKNIIKSKVFLKTKTLLKLFSKNLSRIHLIGVHLILDVVKKTWQTNQQTNLF